jgi:hypothetical protein
MDKFNAKNKTFLSSQKVTETDRFGSRQFLSNEFVIFQIDPDREHSFKSLL